MIVTSGTANITILMRGIGRSVSPVTWDIYRTMTPQNFPSTFGGSEIQQMPYQSQAASGMSGYGFPTQQLTTQQQQPTAQQQQPTTAQQQQPTTAQQQQPTTQQQQPTAQSVYQPSTSGGQQIGAQSSSMQQTPSVSAQPSEMSAQQAPAVQTPGSELSYGGAQGTNVSMTQQSPQEMEQSAATHQGPSLGGEYERTVTPELRAVVDSVDRLANVCEWAEARFAGQGRAGASRACEDIHDRAHETVDFILRGSPFAASAADELRTTIRGALQEIQQHATPEAQEIQQYAQQTDQLLESGLPQLASPFGSSA
jgi:hypothetical protein